MPQIFVFTAGNKAARQHLDDTIAHPLSLAAVDEELLADEAAFVRSLAAEGQGLYAWGAQPGERNIPNWELMTPGDWVLTVFGNQYRYAALVLGKIRSQSLARRLWGEEDGNTWEYMYFLSQPQAIEPSAVPDGPAASYLNTAYRGFARISDQKTAVITGQFGSVDHFMHEMFALDRPVTVIEQEITTQEQAADAGPAFDAQNLVDGRKKVLAEVVRRRGQPQFRRDLLTAYASRCAVTGCAIEDVLEAAHIISYRGEHTNHVTNGILLRADIHTLFDLGLIKISSDGRIHVDSRIGAASDYQALHGKNMAMPANAAHAPDPLALEWKFAGAT